jgi:FkbM family methyltransferase
MRPDSGDQPVAAISGLGPLATDCGVSSVARVRPNSDVVREPGNDTPKVIGRGPESALFKHVLTLLKVGAVNIPGALTVAMEMCGLRGAPTILKELSKLPALKRRVATVTLREGQRISFPAYDAYWCRHLYAGKPYEPDVERIFRQLGKGRVLVDCGANIGYWSAKHKDYGFINSIAIEANPRLIPFLRRNYGGPIHHVAVDSVSGRTITFAGDGALGHIDRSGKGDVRVRTLALRDLDLTDPALVKLDIEGAEIAAIEGLGGIDATLVYEDFPRQGMKVTRYLLKRGWRLFTDRLEPISSVEEVAADLGPGVPRNLIAMR